MRQIAFSLWLLGWPLVVYYIFGISTTACVGGAIPWLFFVAALSCQSPDKKIIELKIVPEKSLQEKE